MACFPVFTTRQYKIYTLATRSLIIKQSGPKFISPHKVYLQKIALDNQIKDNSYIFIFSLMLRQILTKHLYIHSLNKKTRTTLKLEIEEINTAPAANVLEGPQAQWTGPVLHLDLFAFFSDYHSSDDCQ